MENVMEFLENENRATVTFSQEQYQSRIRKIRKLAAEYPEACDIIAENSDGNLYAYIPVTWIKISLPKGYKIPIFMIFLLLNLDICQQP